MATPTSEAPVARNEPRTRTALLLEGIALRHQIAVLERSRTRRPYFCRIDRLFWIVLSRWWQSWRESLMIVQPETVLRWRRSGCLAPWRYRSSGSSGRWRGGRPRISSELRNLIRQMTQENFLWGAPRIHGELLMLGYTVSQAPSRAICLHQADGQPSRGGASCAIKPVHLATIPKRGQGDTRACICQALAIHDRAGGGGRYWTQAWLWTPTVRRERPKNQSTLRPVRARHYAPSASARRGICWSPTSVWQSPADRSCGGKPTLLRSGLAEASLTREQDIAFLVDQVLRSHRGLNPETLSLRIKSIFANRYHD
jgi:hypothetical protein